MDFLQSLASISLPLQNRLIQRYRPPRLQDLRAFYIGGYWRGQNDIVAQMLNGLKTAGVKVFEFNTDEHHEAFETDGIPYDRGTSGPVWLVKEQLFPLILRFRPHLIICNAGGLSFRPPDTATLRKWGIKLLATALSEPDVYAATTSKIAHNFDILYTNDRDSLDVHRAHGVNAYQLPMGTDESFFHPVPAKPEYACDVLHLGAAHPDRVEAVQALTQHFKAHVYGENWEKHGVPNRGFVYGEDALTALSSAKMVIVFSRTPSGQQIIKPQLFNFLSSGCLVVTEMFPDLRRYFEEGKQLVGFKGQADLIEKVRYYLEHPEEADAIRKAGQEKVRQYTWDKIWPGLIARVIRLRQ